MSYNQTLADRIMRYFEKKAIEHEAKAMMGGLCFMVNGKMCIGVEKDRLMARVGPNTYDKALSMKGARPMDFTGRPMRGFVFVEQAAVQRESDLARWLEMALAYNPEAPKSKSKKKLKAEKS